MTPNERDEMIERAMQRLGIRREREAREEVLKPKPLPERRIVIAS